MFFHQYSFCKAVGGIAKLFLKLGSAGFKFFKPLVGFVGGVLVFAAFCSNLLLCTGQLLTERALFLFELCDACCQFRVPGFTLLAQVAEFVAFTAKFIARSFKLL